MIMIVLCLGVAAAAWWGGPRVLTVGRWQVHYPRLTLAAWHSVLAIGVLALMGSVAAAVVAALSAPHAAGVAEGVVQTIVGWCALGVLGAAMVVVATGSDDLAGAGKRTFGDVLSLPHSAVPLDKRTSLLVCQSDELFACAIPGRDAAVVITTALRSALTPAQLAAVVAHERAHLRGHHYVAIRLAELNRACMPSSHAGKKLLRVTSLLVELIADDDAARRAGAVHLANALARMSRLTSDPSMELRAERLAGRQWAPARKLATATVTAPVPS